MWIKGTTDGLGLVNLANVARLDVVPGGAEYGGYMIQATFADGSTMPVGVGYSVQADAKAAMVSKLVANLHNY